MTRTPRASKSADSSTSNPPRVKKAPKKPAPQAPTESAAVYLHPSELKPWAKNPRRNEAAIDAVARSIREFGFAAPIVARAADRRVIAGHTRLAAALRLKLVRVPVRLLDVTAEVADALALADNRLGEIANWDSPALAEILKGLDPSIRDVSGWSEKELERLEVALNPKVPDEFPSVDGSVTVTKCCPKCGFKW